MPEWSREERFERIHIDVARNATDDFNPFHDSRRWQRIVGNPFAGPIVLGFQLECLAEFRVEQFREQERLAEERVTGFRNFHFTFAGALHAGEPFQLVTKPTAYGSPDPQVVASNRIIVRSEHGLVLLGHIRESVSPLVLSEVGVPEVDLRALSDRTLLPDGYWFHKRKFMINSNAKNMVSGSLGDQTYYFDEIEDRIRFPDLFPVSLVSCALLERAQATGHDFYRNPMVYTGHRISVDQGLTRGLRSNDIVHLLVGAAEEAENNVGLGRVDIPQQRHRCLGVLAGRRVLFRAEVSLAPLNAVAATRAHP